MKVVLGIRNRMLLAALLPVALVAFGLVAALMALHLNDLQNTHQQRLRAAALQVAGASRLGLFAEDRVQLLRVASGALLEHDLRAVTILTLDGRVMASAGRPVPMTRPAANQVTGQQWDAAEDEREVLVQPVRAGQVGLESVNEPWVGTGLVTPGLLGHVRLEFSNDWLSDRRTDAMLAGASVALAGLLFGGLLALQLARGFIEPVVRMSRMVKRIGEGDLSTRGPETPLDPLRELQRGLNQMVQGLEVGRDQLEQRVADATRDLRAKIDEAEQATLAKSRFLAAATHDLRQPAHALGLFVERLRQLPHDPQARQVLGNLEASVQSMQELLDALLDISRFSANAVPVQVSAFALNELFDKLRSATGSTARDKGLRLRIRPTSVWLTTDAAQLHRILLNLVGNAMAYTPHGTVLVTCRPVRGGSLARIQVWDSGIGIAPEHHEAVFKDYFQVDNPARSNSKGLGLGLHIVDLTARLLGLSVQLRSNLGCGTRFTIDVPLAPVGTARPLLAAPEPMPLPMPLGLVALVLEDDRLSREAVASLLTSWGFVVRTADSLPAALQLIEDQGSPDVLVSDYRLADWVSGIDAVRQLRAAANRPIPACLMSGTSTPALVQAARDVGLTLLQKPVRPAKLRALVRRLVLEPGSAQNEEADSGEGGAAV
jgi:signal transduction histidine kinase/CheY-like chemotaxis protein